MAEPRTPVLKRDILLDLTALLGGAVMMLSLAPFEWWPLAFLSPALLFYSLIKAGVKRTLLRVYLFNVAMFGTGVSWIWVSVHEYGQASWALASFLVVLLVLAYSLLSLPLAWVYGRFFRGNLPAMVLGFCALWVVQEWIRTWVLTGFPWMYAGYGVMNTPVVHLAPLGGVFALSLAVVLVAAGTVALAVTRHPGWSLPVIFTCVLAVSLGQVSYTESKGSISVSLVQGNIDQHVKWHRGMRGTIRRIYESASEAEWGRDLVVWPEAAITTFREDAAGFLEAIGEKAAQAGSTLVLGIPDEDPSGRFQNTVMAVGQGEGQYIKRRLVPFGEYVPLESVLRGLIALFDLPMARNRTGPMEQPPIRAGNLTLSTSICYEVIYPGLVRSSAHDPDLLLTVSNDTWFGRSLGPHQHMQMARLRAVESGRSLVRATNNGITAVVDWRGDVTASLPQFTPAVLRAEVDIRTGTTPYYRWGDWPVLLVCGFMLAAGLLISRKNPLKTGFLR